MNQKARLHLNPRIFCLFWQMLILPICGQEIRATRTVINPIANFDISYIDISGAGTGPTLFTLQVLPPQPPTDELFYIKFSVTCETDVLSGVIYEAESGRFAFQGEYQNGFIMTSNEFFTNRGENSPSLAYTINRLDEQRMREMLLVAGIVPSGRVFLSFSLLKQSDPAFVVSANMFLDIVTVRYIKLVSPGVNISEASSDIPEAFSPFPQFVWNSDLLPVGYSDNALKFVVSVYENPDELYSAADIPQSRPVWTREITGGSAVNYAQYPASGVRALAVGQKYYWQVRAVLQGPVNREIESDIFVFKVADYALSEVLSPKQKLILQYLQIILGENYGYVITDLKSMVPDETVVLDGKEIDIEKLAELAQEFIMGSSEVRKVKIE